MRSELTGVKCSIILIIMLILQYVYFEKKCDNTCSNRYNMKECFKQECGFEGLFQMRIYSTSI